MLELLQFAKINKKTDKKSSPQKKYRKDNNRYKKKY